MLAIVCRDERMQFFCRTHFSDLASDNDVQSGDAIIAQIEKIPDTDLKMTQ